jgi:hypothetical protein
LISPNGTAVGFVMVALLPQYVVIVYKEQHRYCLYSTTIPHTKVPLFINKVLGKITSL